MVMDQGRPYGMGYENNMHNYMPAPNFTDPWQHQPSQHYSHMKPETRSMPYPHATLPPTSAPMSTTSYATQEIPRSSISYSDHPYSSSHTSAPAYAPQYSSMNYAQSLQHQQAQQQRKTSEVYVIGHRPVAAPRLTNSSGSDTSRSANASFGELDASRGMLALSNQGLTDLTPRNIYDVRQRQQHDYAFPPTASGHSSISAASGRSDYPYYGSSVGSVADSSTDYSSAASDSGYDVSRHLPRPQGMMSAAAPLPASAMMTQFSSKMSGNTQKKHKCKICDKRFTRPSSLQTHMYSHTGEKPFACDVEGCGRNFSVVSNLRRHKKVHKGEGVSVSSQSDTEERHS